MTKEEIILELERLNVKFNPELPKDTLSTILVGAKLADKPEISLSQAMANRVLKTLDKSISELNKAIKFDKTKSGRYNKIINEITRIKTRI
jgi:hypothetical protein